MIANRRECSPNSSGASYSDTSSIRSDVSHQTKNYNHVGVGRSLSSTANLTSLCVDISPSLSNFFEVLYIGKIKVLQKEVPDTFIDEVLERFKIHESSKNNKLNKCSSPNETITRSLQKSDSDTSSEADERLESSNTEESQKIQSKFQEEIDDHNRTMVLQIDRTDLRLVSPDRKIILLHKHHNDIISCLQGRIKRDYFGFISKEGKKSDIFVGYIFKCESVSVANDAVATITQTFSNSEYKPKYAMTSCDHCPMVWFNKLCAEIENLSDRKTEMVILRRLDQLDEEEQNIILSKCENAEMDSVRDKNEFLIMLLRSHCEMKQRRHVHDTAENRSEFLNQYLGGGKIFSKAKRSLTNSFDQFLKRRASKDEFSYNLVKDVVSNLNLNSNMNKSPHSSNNDVSSEKDLDSPAGSQSDLKDCHLSANDSKKNSVSPDRSVGSDKGAKSPMIDIFLKVGNSPKSCTSEEDVNNKNKGSWRQAIFKRVVSSSRLEPEASSSAKRTSEDYKLLWKQAIRQAILLVRMEKENANIKAQQEESAIKRIKLDYDELKPNQREVIQVWEMITNKESRIKCDNQMLLHAIRQGVPRGKRGEVWQFLAEQFCVNVAPIDLTKYPNYNVPYEKLLKQLTSHQHAILIDLGRTFPNHSYFSSPLGPGQLALFNLLKAYSLLDPEVGYCQGLSFVAGVLLLHMEESKAFFLLKHLMFRRNLRKQYLPDMIALQIKLYQLSRLLHDEIPELYKHFDFYEVAPTLYAAPWLLTIFASQFSLGFVTRIFDLLFLEGMDVIFRVALALLSHHKDKLLACDSFEEILDYLKVEVPNITKPTLNTITKQVYTTDFKKQLNEYKVEYQVLREELNSVQPQVEAVHKLEVQNKTLTEQNKALLCQLELALSNVQRLEKTRTLQQSQLNRLEMHSRGLDVTIATLGNFINNLIEQKVDIEIPGEVRRIISQISFVERRKSDLRLQNNLLNQVLNNSDKIMVKSLSTGKIPIPNSIDLNMYRSNSLNSEAIKQDLQSQTNSSPSGSSPKISQFFSNSHSNILQQKFNSQNNLFNNSKVDIKIQDVENENVVKNTENVDHHPLSNCDVNFKFSGTKELLNIRNKRHTSPNLITDVKNE